MGYVHPEEIGSWNRPFAVYHQPKQADLGGRNDRPERHVHSRHWRKSFFEHDRDGSSAVLLPRDRRKLDSDQIVWVVFVDPKNPLLCGDRTCRAPKHQEPALAARCPLVAAPTALTLVSWLHILFCRSGAKSVVAHDTWVINQRHVSESVSCSKVAHLLSQNRTGRRATVRV